MARGQNINSMVFNKPLLVTLDSLQPITDYLSNPERVANLKLEKPKEEVLLGLSDFGNRYGRTYNGCGERVEKEISFASGNRSRAGRVGRYFGR